MALKSVYCLVANNPGGERDLFYVGCTNNTARRLREHQLYSVDEKHREYMTDKYQYIRYCNSNNIPWGMEILSPETEISDEFDEYHWVLLVARDNERLGVRFGNGQPICNMRAGDLLSVMLADKNLRHTGPDELREWNQRRNAAVQQRKRVNLHQLDSWAPDNYQENPEQYQRRTAIMESIFAKTEEQRNQARERERVLYQRRARLEESIREARQEQAARWYAEQLKLMEGHTDENIDTSGD